MLYEYYFQTYQRYHDGTNTFAAPMTDTATHAAMMPPQLLSCYRYCSAIIAKIFPIILILPSDATVVAIPPPMLGCYCYCDATAARVLLRIISWCHYHHRWHATAGWFHHWHHRRHHRYCYDTIATINAAAILPTLLSWPSLQLMLPLSMPLSMPLPLPLPPPGMQPLSFHCHQCRFRYRYCCHFRLCHCYV